MSIPCRVQRARSPAIMAGFAATGVYRTISRYRGTGLMQVGATIVRASASSQDECDGEVLSFRLLGLRGLMQVNVRPAKAV